MVKHARRTRKRRSGGAESIDPASVSAITAEGHQPSNKIMEWATTACIPVPLNMQNVAHGGKRSMKRSRKHRRKHRKHSGKHRKHSGKRSMKRSRKHRGGECGPCMMQRP